MIQVVKGSPKMLKIGGHTYVAHQAFFGLQKAKDAVKSEWYSANHYRIRKSPIEGWYVVYFRLPAQIPTGAKSRKRSGRKP